MLGVKDELFCSGKKSKDEQLTVGGRIKQEKRASLNHV